jgi:hypothetical protein
MISKKRMTISHRRKIPNLALPWRYLWICMQIVPPRLLANADSRKRNYSLPARREPNEFRLNGPEGRSAALERASSEEEIEANPPFLWGRCAREISHYSHIIVTDKGQKEWETYFRDSRA